MSFIDGSAVNVALPVIQRDLHATAQDGQWVVESYAVFLSALMLIGGSLGDVFGRKFIFGTGIAVFAAASLACALSPTIETLIVARSLQGVGAALATPGSLALISASFTGEARGKAIGTWSGFSAMTAALGPVLGGFLVQYGSWRAVFLINLPLAAIVIAILALRVAESRDEAASRDVDVAGAAFATLGLGAVVYGLIGVQSDPHNVPAIAAAAAGIAILVAFVFLEARQKNPMMRLEIFRSRRFSAANVYTFLLYATLGGSLYLVPFDLINVQHYPPAFAGAAMLPFILIMVAFSRFSGGLVARIGARLPLVCGATLAAAGFACYGLAGVGHSYWITFFPAAVLLGCGGAFFVAPLTTTVMDAAPSAHAGIASGINNAVSRIAGLIAIAALGIVVANAFDAQFRRTLACTPVAGTVCAFAIAHEPELMADVVPKEIDRPRERATIAAAANAAYAGAFSVAMFVSAAIALLAALVGLDPSFARTGESSRPFDTKLSSR
jgi:EmrB/QacA subfamily drug resistance transporter